MEAAHGLLEWFLLLAVVATGFAIDRWAPHKKVRYPIYLVVLLVVFIFDLNKISFRHAALNAVLYLVVMLIIAESFRICIRKRSRLLLGGAFVVLTPVLLYAYAALLLVVPLPCHKYSTERVDTYTACGGKTYTLTKRLSFDPFNPARLYILTKDIPSTPLRKQIDKFSTPKGYIEASFVPMWQCNEGRGRVDLYIDGYTLWSLLEKKKEE